MSIARVIFQSPRVDTYADVVAAIATTYNDIIEIKIIFVNQEVDEEWLDGLQKRLTELSSIPNYAQGARLRITGFSCSLESPQLYRDPGILDVTAIAKHTAVEVATGAIEYPHLKVCHLRWLTDFRKGKENRVGRDDFLYEDLLSKGATAKLLKNYVAKRHVLLVYTVLFAVMVVVFLFRFFVPSFRIPDDVINLFSLLLGGSGLWLSIVALQRA
jgi:hypothetical protein